MFSTIVVVSHRTSMVDALFKCKYQNLDFIPSAAPRIVIHVWRHEVKNKRMLVESNLSHSHSSYDLKIDSIEYLRNASTFFNEGSEENLTKREPCFFFHEIFPRTKQWSFGWENESKLSRGQRHEQLDLLHTLLFLQDEIHSGRCSAGNNSIYQKGQNNP